MRITDFDPISRISMQNCQLVRIWYLILSAISIVAPVRLFFRPYKGLKHVMMIWIISQLVLLCVSRPDQTRGVIIT